MHLYFITRGIKKEVDQFITELQGKYLEFNYRANKKDKFQKAMLQVAVRPIQLWEIAYPEEHNDLMLTTIFGKEIPKDYGMRDKGLAGWLRKMAYGFRKILRVDPIPEYKATSFMPINKQHISFLPIGIKKDYIEENGYEGI